MKKLKNVLSLFDGISCLQEVLNRAGIVFNKYYASEIDNAAVQVALKNFPNTKMVGDVRDLDPRDFKNITLFSAGFPCTDLSLMGKRRGMVTSENVSVTSLEQYLKLKESGFEFEGQSYLFWEMIRLFKGIDAEYYLIENVAKIDPQWLEIINNELGCPYVINASTLTSQNRDRFYWTNIPQFEYPEDRGLTLNNIIPGAIPAGIRGVLGSTHPDIPNPKNNKWVPKMTMRKDGKANCLVTSGGGTNLYVLNGTLNQLTPEECEVIQTLKAGFTDIKGISKSTRYKLIGNGWSIDAVVPFFKSLTVDNRRK